ncbi:bifunctional adenosylcobinamide kinase/adenosylcobinamide-phosphate guanylyltransferase [Desulfitobacterium chlororespirans]|uniref:Adenosylcobinamide kinase n=1 Tax=Desulfitobacterium chlororespirans DSM 11544 TaxID=1121395 RepID=A0A1M7UPP6_9FIRM|nr:bifunctional adenosylcobinamide kinase/adenosylcobinamide-phosphate guanylyltransferase [Desulfitobacterium chlororespirans]SHN84924.1 adenosylcobinamide kinase /adenosylcobinamide-phosphate guanylyltransferase [Desulfitobacterium chlororespirans DSM 11544]
MSDFVLITGGARSGKSRFAELLAAHPGLPVTYIATAQVYDEEMALRVRKHQDQRPAHWGLVEEPLALPDLLEGHAQDKGVLLVDCVTLWLTNLLLARYPAEDNLTEQEYTQALHRLEQEILEQVRIVARIAQDIGPQVIMVTNEVGDGIVPDNPLSRFYRDLAGRANQILGQSARHVYSVVAGYPTEIKAAGQALLDSLRREDA